LEREHRRQSEFRADGQWLAPSVFARARRPRDANTLSARLHKEREAITTVLAQPKGFEILDVWFGFGKDPF